jgi:hypothetical protein
VAWPKAGVCLLRGGARAAIDGQDAQQRRSAADRGQRGEAAGAIVDAEIPIEQINGIDSSADVHDVGSYQNS